MAGFFDNVTGRQKLVLIFGGAVLLIATRALFPEEAQWMRAWVADLFSAAVDLFPGG